MRALVAVVLLSVLAGCTPFYRVDQVQGLRVASGEERARLQERARALMSEGQPRAAAEAWEAAVELDPSPSAESFLAMAQARAAAGERLGARAAARQGLASGNVAASTGRALRELLVRQYAADGLVEPALDFLPDARLETALEVPELARALGVLADADRLARSGSLDAVGRYEQWLADFGAPTHRLLVSWSSNVYRVAAGPTAQAVLDADRALGEGRADEAAQLYALAFRFQAPADFEAKTRTRLETACARAGEGLTGPEAQAEALRGNEALAGNQLGEALASYRRAVALSPCWPEARHNLALLLARLEQHGEALRHLRAFMRTSSDAARVARAQGLAVEWERRADPAQAERLQSEAAERDASLARQRSRARDWRDAGFVFMSTGAVVGAGAVACAVVGLRVNEQVRAGDFDTGRDFLLAADVGRTANTLGTILAVSAGAMVAIGLPIVLFNLDPAAPTLSAVAGPGFAGVAVSGVLP